MQHRIILPGATTLTRLISEVREKATKEFTMKLVPFFFAFFFTSPDREAIRRIRKNAKTNNKASHPGAFFI